MAHYVRSLLDFLRKKVVLNMLIAPNRSAICDVRISRQECCPDEYRNPVELEVAMSYRKPMEVKEVVYYPVTDGQYALCPRCRVTMEREYVRFCDRCGQCLNWENYDNALVVLKTGVSVCQNQQTNAPL